MINPQWLELPMPRTNFPNGPKDVRASEDRTFIESVHEHEVCDVTHDS